MCHNGWKNKDCRNIDFGDLERDNDCFQKSFSRDKLQNGLQKCLVSNFLM